MHFTAFANLQIKAWVSRTEAAEVRKSIIHSSFDYIIVVVVEKKTENNRSADKFLVVMKHMTHGKVMFSTD